MEEEDIEAHARDEEAHLLSSVSRPSSSSSLSPLERVRNEDLVASSSSSNVFESLFSDSLLIQLFLRPNGRANNQPGNLNGGGGSGGFLSRFQPETHPLFLGYSLVICLVFLGFMWNRVIWLVAFVAVVRFTSYLEENVLRKAVLGERAVSLPRLSLEDLSRGHVSDLRDTDLADEDMERQSLQPMHGHLTHAQVVERRVALVTGLFLSLLGCGLLLFVLTPWQELSFLLLLRGGGTKEYASSVGNFVFWLIYQDRFVRFSSIACKCFLSLLWTCSGKQHQLEIVQIFFSMEGISTIYRHLLTYALWTGAFLHITESDWINVLLLIVYTVYKLYISYHLAKFSRFSGLCSLKSAIQSIESSMILVGHRCSGEDIAMYGGGSCPICLESLHESSAFQLRCGHIFCENCIMDWLQRQAHCPVCRRDYPSYSLSPHHVGWDRLGIKSVEWLV